MEKKFICNNKYQFRNQTIALPISLENLPDQVIIEGNILLLKSSFHVSLICIGEIIKKHNVIIQDFENKIIEDFCEFSKANEIKITHFSNEFKFAVKNDLQAIIVMCEVSGINNFFDFLNQKYSLKIEYPPTHVTLYTLPEKSGIFLTDKIDIKNLTKDIKNPIDRLL